ncbi:CRISPR-associated helicase Cas3' [Methylomonas sp. UP202]|uniref:CRISPR-associated helicase Cas3' n=1 Tax=Methylomonas sp. UP202 TaxID=3040943 RepID=UPI0024798B8E|nr:CRISPR-associated helicase Cas3' [Methylomonas sp. UP202]WGS83802.1 CRISPR-associated helicase Cas3' [Methylomonas sp. UP202]
MTQYIAHIRNHDKKIQTLDCHLYEASELSRLFASKLGIADAGALIGLMHDFGKFSKDFQNYILTETGLCEPDADYPSDQRGKIDHSTAGAQWVWQTISSFTRNGNHDEGMLCGQILALCIASHHGGLIDNLSVDGDHLFKKRIEKLDGLTHLGECKIKGVDILQKAQALAGKELLVAMLKRLRSLGNPAETTTNFNRGMWTRFLFSCLIDADRISSADFEYAENTAYRQRQKPSWAMAIERLENHLKHLADKPVEEMGPIDSIRQTIANACLQRASEDQGIYTLTVPTGGGKTLASLRYALHHAQTHQLERVIYVIPYTSIIEQNAEVMRSILEHEQDEFPWVLEHHSNLEPETQTWHSKLAAENWDAPIIVTTMVQFLETLFGGGTRGVRRLHQLANSVIIFDEIQTLPIRCTHLFCNALNFLNQQTKTTAVLCTATQPLLNKLPERVHHKGQLQIPDQNELMPDVADLFEQLRRTEIKSMLQSQGWSETEIAALALNELRDKDNCLVIVNTKAWAQKLYQLCRAELDDQTVFHLSTNLCSAHRQAIFQAMRQRLDDKQPVLCISTQLIEAGVDIDFASVIRFMAGLDSIAQAAGRCNRNGRLPTASVLVVNPAKESIEQLKDIKQGQAHSRRVLDELGDSDLLSPQAMSQYFKYYFFDRANEMDYPVPAKQLGVDDSLLNLLSKNDKNPQILQDSRHYAMLRQSFKAAAQHFKVIDAPTESLLVPWGEGKELITELCGLDSRDTKALRRYLKQAQKFSVNVFPNDWEKLTQQHAAHQIGETGVYYLEKQYYSDEFGLTTTPVGKAEADIL